MNLYPASWPYPRTWLARKLRQLAQKLSPLLTDAQIREIREEVCCGGRQTYNIYAADPDEVFEQMRRREDQGYGGRY
jgi:hypothetical protein